MSRCTGHCCHSFVLPEGAYVRICDDATTVEDGHKLLDMLIPLGLRMRHTGKLALSYTCRHHDRATGDCRIYDERPSMCERYPYGRPCEMEGCTMTEAPTEQRCAATSHVDALGNAFRCSLRQGHCKIQSQHVAVDVNGIEVLRW